MKNKLLTIAVVILICGCTTVKRYKKVETVSADPNNDKVGIALFGTKVDAAKEEDNAKSLWELQGEGQAELIKSLNGRYKEDEKFIAQLNTKYLKPKEKKATDFTNKDLKLIFSISKKRDYSKLKDTKPAFTLADRIEYIKFTITIPDKTNLNFIKWNKFTTEYATIDIADVSFTQSLELAGSLGTSSTRGTEATETAETLAKKATTGSSFTPSASTKGTASKTEAQKVRYRYVQLNGKISDKVISIEQEGMREIDLNGNVIVDVNLKFDEIPEILSTAEGLKKDEKFAKVDDVKLILYPVLVPKVEGLPDKLDATLNYEYTYRHVVKGEKTFYEWDDEVEYITGASSKTITLFRKKDFVPAFAHIAKLGEDAKAFKDRTRLGIQETFGNKDTYELIFGSNSEAAEFLDWLRRFPVDKGKEDAALTMGSYTLKLRTGGTDTDLTYNEFKKVTKQMQNLSYYR